MTRRVWFVRTGGKTLHNQPGTPLFVPGEPPCFPRTVFQYRATCLERGFARLGMPASGDLRLPGWRDRALQAYGSAVKKFDLRALELFRSITIGDLIVMPAGVGPKKGVHLGIVGKPPNGLEDGSAYFYQKACVASEDWFENAHRVNVSWARTSDGTALTFPSDGLSWRPKLSEVKLARQSLLEAANKAGLISSTEC